MEKVSVMSPVWHRGHFFFMMAMKKEMITIVVLVISFVTFYISCGTGKWCRFNYNLYSWNIAYWLLSIDSFHQFIWCKYLHLGETKPLFAQVLYGCSYMIHIIVYTKEAVISHEHVTNDLIMSLLSYFKIALSLFWCL